MCKKLRFTIFDNLDKDMNIYNLDMNSFTKKTLTKTFEKLGDRWKQNHGTLKYFIIVKMY